MTTHKVVPHDDWVAARMKHLAKEKEFTHMRDQLSRERRDLPWELVEKEYIFEGEAGSKPSLSCSRDAISWLSITRCSTLTPLALLRHGRKMPLATPVRSGWTISMA